MHPLLSTVATLILFFGPGLLFVAVLGGSKQRIALSLGEQLYLLLATSLLLSGWVGLFLAELGRFSSLSTATLVAGLVFFGILLPPKNPSLPPRPLGSDE